MAHYESTSFLFVILLFFILHSDINANNQNSNRDTVKIFKASYADFTSELPIVIINTNSQTIVNDPKIDAHMSIIYNGQGMINHIMDENYDYNGNIGIELRGNSTQKFEKKPYGVETRDTEGNNLNVEILGMPAENDWVFRASYIDRTFIRNPLAHHLSQKTGHWSSRFRLCELFINSEYLGIYIILEKIKRDKNRVNISRLTPDKVDEVSITGGYIYEITGFNNDFGKNRRIRYPKPDVINLSQLDYIRDYDDDFRELMESNDWNNPLTGYTVWIDVYSFIDEMIVQEAMRNSDAYGWSAFFYKDRNGPLMAGPVWDFDQAAGNSSYNEGFDITGWVFDMWSSPSPEFWGKLFEDPLYKSMMKERWFELRQGAFSDFEVENFIDSIASLLQNAQIRNFEKWKILGKELWRDTPGWENRLTYDDYVFDLKDYMMGRLNWIDAQLKRVPTQINYTNSTIENGNIETAIYPNPVKTILYLDLKVNEPSSISVMLSNISGQYINGFNLDNFTGNKCIGINVEELQDGFYLLRISNRDGTEIVHKFLKSKKY